VILQLWIITWPILWFLTRRYEVVSCQWPYTQTMANGTKIYATGKSEDQWAEMWKPAVQRAALGKRQGGEWITGRDILLAEEARVEDGRKAQRRAESREETRRGSGFMNAIVGIAQGIGDANSEYDRRVGWGGDRD
jgi:hypothetical protein